MTLLDVEVADFVRDQWQRPLIVPPEGGRPVPYTRASRAAKLVEDTWNLEWWERRNVVFGMAHDRSLVARVLALGGDPKTWTQQQRDEANEIIEDATTVAQARSAADEGTALHRMTEIVDRNKPLIAGPYEADIEAYVNALAVAGYEVDPAYIECRLVCDELKMAGTADRILTRSSDRMRLIADLKTGASVDYGGLGWAAQLAVYAHGQLYDVTAGVRLETPPIDRATGIIIHLPAGQGVCKLYEIDLVAGYRAAQLANEIAAIRREAKRWITPLVTSAPVVEAQQRHPSGSAAGLPAPAVEPSKGEVVELLGRQHDEGGEIDDERLAKVHARHDALPAASQLWLGSLAAEAQRAGVPFYLRQTSRTFRRYWLHAALIMLAEDGVDDPDFVRALVARATESDAPLFPTVTVGHAVGAMGAVEARRFCDAAAELRRGELKADFSGPAMRLVPIT